MRVRDEHKMTLAAYQTLYRSAVEYGMRKQVESEEGMDELEW
jgi:dynein light intermediate chain